MKSGLESFRKEGPLTAKACFRKDSRSFGVLPKGRKKPRFHRGIPDILNSDILEKRVGRDFQSFCKFAKKLGAVSTKVISVDTVVTAPWVRLKCQYGCDGYGEYLTCPPYSPTPEKTREVLKHYRKAILVHGDDHTDITRIVARLEREAFLSGYYKAYGMGSGPCGLCNRCDVNKPCKKPYQARPSMEASGIDVFKTARNNGFKVEVLKSPDCKGNYFGLVLII